MKRIFLLVLIALAAGCNKESDVSPASGTFIRYFGSENNNDAVLAIEAQDGFILLSNIEIQLSATEVVNKIKIIKTNFNGDFQSEKVFPQIGNNNVSAKGMSLIPTPGGYLIVGEWIKSDTSELLLITTTDQRITSNESLVEDSVTISGRDIDPVTKFYKTASLSGRSAIVSETTGSFIVLAEIKNSPDDMFVAEINPSDLTMSWNRKYRGNARNEVVNRIFSNNNQLFWSTTVTTTVNPDQKDIRIVEAPMNSESTVTADPVKVSPASNEIAGDFCRMAGGWAVIGSTNVKGDADIYFLRTSTNGTFISERTNVAYEDGDLDPELNDEGKSITVANDGNLVLFGTVDTEENQQEWFLTKISSATNARIWRHTYGGGEDDVAASVRSLSDGSYLVFGTTYFGRSRKLMLMKLNPEGVL